jgi:L-aspartate oxidase
MAPRILLATGGIGALYEVTTNPSDSCGEGLGMAARAGALIADPEFVQFHPTALAVGRDPAPLASEALRGEGAWLINQTGARFCFDHHKDGELAPRDVVARAIYAELRAGNVVYLDTRAALGDTIEQRFPTIFASAMAAGIDPRTRPIPVRPAAHYHMGGIAVTVDGTTSLPGLWAAGEVAATGVHGANRLASNSLLDALVTGARAAAAMAASERKIAMPASVQDLTGPFDPNWQTRLRHVMSQYAGGLRDAAGLAAGLDQLSALEASVHGHQLLANRLAAARLVLTAALNRRESRGAHARADFPSLAPAAERSFLSLRDCRSSLLRRVAR